MGFAVIYSSSCDGDIRIINFNNALNADQILSPIMLIICYLIVAVTSKVLLIPKVILKLLF